MQISSLTLKNPVFLAPMAGITDAPFRLFSRRFGCSLACTEMVSSNGLIRGVQRSLEYIEHIPEDTPLGVQIFGSDPDIMAEAVKIAADHGAALIDLNMGCPVKKVVKTGAGAALLKDPSRIGAIIRAVRQATSLPLTVKIRSGWCRSNINAKAIALIAQNEGADALTLHPRTADQGFTGSSDWDLIKEVKSTLSVPVIGSGDIWSPDDALRMMKDTGCDAIMIGRGALGNPWVFEETLDLLAGRVPRTIPLSEKQEIIMQHLEMTLDHGQERQVVTSFRKHLLWYTKGLRGGADFRRTASMVSSRTELFYILSELFNNYI